MKAVMGCLILCIWLVGIPLLTGAIPAFFTKRHRNPAFMWVSGYMISWALFQLETVPLVLTHISRSFAALVKIFGISSLAVAAAGAFLLIRSRKSASRLSLVRGDTKESWANRI